MLHNEFAVHIDPGNHKIQVAPNETILAAGLRQGVDLLYGCRGGFCGTCEAELLQGEVAYPKGTPSMLQNSSQNVCLLCQAVPLTDVSCRVNELIQNTTPQPQLLVGTVESCEHLTHDVVRLILKLPSNTRLNFLAGQYLELILDNGQRRAFSLANSPHQDTNIELHIRQVPGGLFTEKMLANLTAGVKLQVNAPLGSFTLRASARPLLFVAGGTGFAPIKGLIEQALQNNAQRSITLYWGVRSRRDLYLSTITERWINGYPKFTFVPVLSEPDLDWNGRRGFVHQALSADYLDASNVDAYLAGPPVMVKATCEVLEAAGLERMRIFSDAFEYAATRS